MIVVLVLGLSITCADDLPSWKVTGVDKIALENIMNRLHNVWLMRPPGDVYTALSLGEEQIKLALRPFGYFHPKISLTKPVSSLQKPSFHYTIEPGPQMTVRQVRLELETEPNAPASFEPALLLGQLDFEEGSPFTSQSYAEAQEKLIDLVKEKGFYYANADKSQLTLNTQTNHADIVFILHMGEVFHFGPLNVQSDVYPSAMIERYAQFKKGQPYQANQITDLNQALRDSQLFSQVLVEPRFSSKVTTVPVSIRLKEEPNNLYSFAFGYGTDIGFKAELQNRRRHLSRYGAQLRSRVSYAPNQQLAELYWWQQGDRPLTDQTSITAHAAHNQNLATGTSDGVMFQMQRSTKVSQWRRTLMFNMLFEHSRPDNTTAYQSNLFYPGVHYDYQSKDKSAFFKDVKGHIALQGTSAWLLSSQTFLQLQGKVGTKKALTRDIDLGLRGEWGVTLTSDLEHLPLTLKMYNGGARSLRGFAYQSIGPGRIMQSYTIEGLRKVYDQFYGMVFTDTGMASDKLTGPWYASAGIGLVWDTPVGHMVLSYAKPYAPTSNHWRIQFTMMR